ncbi:MAG: T9SS type A sorting domain-containing protein [Saprospiraceae bacterium]|nr:T9SS type A sorting domain-containing protein [Saprospiraceae bacterium]
MNISETVEVECEKYNYSEVFDFDFNFVSDSIQSRYRAFSLNYGLENPCDIYSKYSYFSIDVIDNSCKKRVEEFLIRVKSKTATQDIYRTVYTGGESISFIISDLEAYLNYNLLGALYDAEVEIYVKDSTGLYFLNSFPLDLYYKNSLENGTLYDLSNGANNEYYNLAECYFCDITDDPDGIKISSDYDESINGCVSLEDYILSKERGTGISRVKFCIDLAGLEEPMVSFDLRMLSNSPYKNLVRLFQDDILLNGTGIETTQLKLKNFTVPLIPKDGIAVLDFNVLLTESKVFLDNVKVFDRVVATEELPEKQVLGTKIVNNTWSLDFENSMSFDFNLFDVSGNMVLSKMNQKSNRFILDSSALPSGMYFYKFYSERTVESGRILVMH